jgi:SAM-dependent methyltransferase
MKWFRRTNAQTHQPVDESLGLGVPPGGEHYRAYVGPPEDYDLMSAMTFGLLTSLGLRQHHKVLDIGCGSLRIGRLLIPYLNTGNYSGVEPNRWLVQDGIKREIGPDQIAIKKPTIRIADNLDNVPADAKYDFAFAQSIFSHCGVDLIQKWLDEISLHLADNGAFAATFLVADEDFQGDGWIYPGCVRYRPETMVSLAVAAGLQMVMLDWKHPRQSWALFYKPGFDASWIRGGHVSWNTMFDEKVTIIP